jgi:isoquinoline 1-oxidoreductase subunit alpha
MATASPGELLGARRQDPLDLHRVVDPAVGRNGAGDPCRAHAVRIDLPFAIGWQRYEVVPRSRRAWFDASRDNKTNVMITLHINGSERVLDEPVEMPLLWALRDVLGLTGTKFGCGIAQCGACTVHVDGTAVRSCQLPIGVVGTRQVTTIEAIGETSAGRRIQHAWLDLEVVQCGYCQPGQIMSAAALLAQNPAPTDADIDAAMAGNLCRCGTYVRIREGIKHAARSV